jgi:CO dehydrogenase maturation factor
LADRAVLVTICSTVDAAPRDRARFTRQAVDVHLRNAFAWANDRPGPALSTQVGPDFVMHPDPSTTAGR